jgi:hypothetical protein
MSMRALHKHRAEIWSCRQVSDDHRRTFLAAGRSTICCSWWCYQQIGTREEGKEREKDEPKGDREEDATAEEGEGHIGNVAVAVAEPCGPQSQQEDDSAVDGQQGSKRLEQIPFRCRLQRGQQPMPASWLLRAGGGERYNKNKIVVVCRFGVAPVLFQEGLVHPYETTVVMVV